MFVLLVYKETLWLHVSKQAVAEMMNVLQMKSVILLLVVASLARNVNLSVILATVTLVLIVLPGTIKRPADVGHPYQEMAMQLVWNVSLDNKNSQRIQLFLIACACPVLAIEAEDPECRVDRDCPPKLTCMSEICQNPCLVTNPCSRSQQCVVTDTPSSIRSVACICPEGTLAGYGGTCESGKLVF